MRYGLQAGRILTAIINDGAIWQHGSPEARIEGGTVTFGPYDENRDYVTKGDVDVTIEHVPAVLELTEEVAIDDVAPVEIVPAKTRSLMSLTQALAKRSGTDS